MKIIILGSGTSTGVPMVGCNCPVCRSDEPKDRRSRSSLLLRYQNRFILIDSGPDLRLQLLREAVPTIDALLFTHHHADHVNGIDDLRGFHFLHNRVIPAYGCRGTITHLQSCFSYIFQQDENSTHPHLLDPYIISEPFQLFGLTIDPIPLLHGSGSSTGYRIGSFAYLTDCSAIPGSSLKRLQGVRTVVIDGLRWSPHPYHFNIPQAIEAARSFGAEQIVLTHLTHEVSYKERNRLPDGVEFAFDGQVIEPK